MFWKYEQKQLRIIIENKSSEEIMIQPLHLQCMFKPGTDLDILAMGLFSILLTAMWQMCG